MKYSKIIYTAFAGGLFCLLFAFSSQAQSPIQVTRDALTFNLPEDVTFSLSANSPAEITDVTLIYDTVTRSCQDSTATRPMQFTPGQVVDIDWQLDFQQRGALLPGEQIWWQWQIEDSAGNRLLTEKKALTIQDQRQNWQEATSGPVTVQWYEGSHSFGSRLAQIGSQSQSRLLRDAGMTEANPLTIVIYPDAVTLREALVQSQTWTGGVALPGENLIILGIAPNEMDWAKEVIPHEISHLVFNDLTANCSGVQPPTWLDEGLSERVMGQLLEADRQLVLQALEQNHLKSLKSLSGEFSAYGDEATRDYAHSRMVVDYLIKQYGSQKMAALLAAFQDGEDTDEALQRAYGFDSAGLDAEWRRSLGFTVPTPVATAQGAAPSAIPTLALWTPVVHLSPTPLATETPLPTETPQPSATSMVAVNQTTPTQSILNTLPAAPAETQTSPATAKTSSRGGGLCGGLLPLLLLGIWIAIRKKK